MFLLRNLSTPGKIFQILHMSSPASHANVSDPPPIRSQRPPRAFMADGGTVIMCGACSKAAGLTREGYIDGVTMGSRPVVQGWLFREGMQTLAW